MKKSTSYYVPGRLNMSYTSHHVNGSAFTGEDNKLTEKTEKFTNNTEATDDIKATQQQIRNLETELKHARDALSALKSDRKRLKAEKCDLLNQMKQLYATLEDKEKELRDFIRAYEQRMRESELALRQLIQERDEIEREKWTILRHARDEAERCLLLTTQLTLRDEQISQLHDELIQLRQQLTRRGSCLTMSPCAEKNKPTQRSSVSSMDSTLITNDPNEEPLYSRIDHSSSNESTTVQQEVLVEKLLADVDSLSLTSVSTVPSSLPTLVPDDGQREENRNGVASCSASNLSSKSSEQLNLSSVNSKTLGKLMFGKSTNGPWGTLTRVFARHKQRRTIDMGLFEGSLNRDSRRSWSPRSSLCTTPLTEESVADRFRFWDELQNLPMERWKAGHLLAWLEFALGMGQYMSSCAENIKSGKVLLELSDSELEAGLGITHPMHKKKIQLAIDEHRQPSCIRYPQLGCLGNTWVTSEWLADIGLTQYTESFTACLVDARLLDNLTKRELEKYLGVTRKAHQTSIVHGITFLRMLKYDRQVIAERRKQCENTDCDPLVWTNQRFITWARSIDLNEYADNLKDSGIHGALVVLSPSFNADTMAAALGISPSKTIIRRHLATELESLIQVARARYEQQSRQAKIERKRAEKLAGGSLGRNFSRSFTGGLSIQEKEDLYSKSGGVDNTINGSKLNMRASLSRAFGRKVKQELLSNTLTNAHHSSEDSESVKGATDFHLPRGYPNGGQLNGNKNTSTIEKHRRVKSSSDIDSITITRV